MLATFAAEMFAYFEARGSAAIHAENFDASISEVAKRLGVDTTVVLSMPLARSIAANIAEKIKNTPGQIKEELFDPAGGWQAVAEAGGSKLLREMADKAFDGPVRNVGYALSLVAAIKLHHPTIQPSLNRAFAVMEKTCNGQNWVSISERSLKDNWKQWRAVAPIGAALWTFEQQRIGINAPADWFEKAMKDPDGLKLLLRWAKWFRGFGVGFYPKGGQGSLIPADEAFDYDIGLSELRPSILPLSPDELKAAQAYRAAVRMD